MCLPAHMAFMVCRVSHTPYAGTGYALHRSGLPAVSDTALRYSHTPSTDQDLPEQAVFPDYLPQITAFVSCHRY